MSHIIYQMKAGRLERFGVEVSDQCGYKAALESKLKILCFVEIYQKILEITIFDQFQK